MFCFQWIFDQVWEPGVRKECCVAKEQEADHPRLWIPSSPGELKHVQEGFWLQLVELPGLSRIELSFFRAGYFNSGGLIAFRDSYNISASSSEREKSGACFFFLNNICNVYIPEYLSQFNLAFCLKSGILALSFYGFCWKCIYDGHIQDVGFIWWIILSMKAVIPPQKNSKGMM